MSKFVFGLVVLSASASASAQEFCSQYNSKPGYQKAISIVAERMKYSTEQLCSLPTLADIYVVDTTIYNLEKQRPEAHTWVTLHYMEHSCQYFVRNEDGAVTRRNCYNTY